MNGRTPTPNPRGARAPGRRAVPPVLVRAGFAAVVAGALAGVLTGCAGGAGAPVWTAGTAAGRPEPPRESADSGRTTAAPSAGSGAAGQAWKVYTDPGRKVRFEVPQDWIVQSVPPDPGTGPGALKIEVKDARGGYLATLRTRLPAPADVPCGAEAAKPYVVVSSVPVQPAAGRGGSVEPRVVFRVIQGYKYFGSYGITNIAGGADGTGCALQNVVRDPEGAGYYSFADLTSLTALAPDQKVAPAKAFDTLDQAAGYVHGGAEFASVQRVLLSLKIKN